MSPLLVILCILVAPILALCAFIRWNPGASGEWMLHLALSLKLDKNRFRILRNVMLPTSDGATTQIDHIVVTQGGVFVIETKTYGNNDRGSRPGSCWIFGNAHDREWTASYPHGIHFRFQNPLRQNYKHLATLSECLGIPIEYFKSIVAFAGMAKFKTEMPPDVMHFCDVPGYILARGSDDVIKPEQVPEVAETILSWQATLTRERKAAHVANLRKNHPATRTTAPASVAPSGDDAPAPVCPKCGAPMVLRTRKSDGGSFWGCSAYPRCRGIRDAQPTA
jgi:hypothetical protein